MNKKIFWISSLVTVIPVSAGLTFGLMNTQKAPLSDLGKLQNFAKDTKELQKFLEKDYEQLASDLQTNTQYTGWVEKLTEEDFQNVDNSIVEISNLNMALNEKAFLLLNFLEKVDNLELKTNIDQNILANSWQSEVSADPNVYINIDNNIKAQIKNQNEKWLVKNGVDKKTTRYSTFKDDLTYFYMSNQAVLDLAYSSYVKELKVAKSKSDQDLEKAVGKSGYERIQDLLSGRSIPYAIDNVPYDQALLKAYNNNYYDFLEKAGRISDKYHFANYYYPTEFNPKPVVSVYDLFILNVLSTPKPNSFEDMNKITEKALQQALWDMGIFQDVDNIWNNMTINSNDKTLDWVNLLLFAFNPLAVITNPLINSNYDDHGLNDWNYQWKYNAFNMTINAINWSEDFTKGIYWKVSDGWFYTPRLEIGTQGEGLRNISGKSSGGNNFNWGKKIPIYYK